MNYRTFLACFLLALPLQVSKLSKSGSLGFIELLIAFLGACGLALVWAYMATWMRIKFAKDLTESYITKIQISFGTIGTLLLIINIFFIDNGISENKPIGMLEEAGLRADAALVLQKQCKETNSNSAISCEQMVERLTECLGESGKPKSELIESIQRCNTEISKDFLKK